MNIDLTTFQIESKTHDIPLGLIAVCRHMQPLIAGRGFSVPSGIRELTNPVGVIGAIDQKNAALRAAAIAASSAAAASSLARHRTLVKFKGVRTVDTIDQAIAAAEAISDMEAAPPRARTPGRRGAKTPTPAKARARVQSPTPGVKRLKTNRAGGRHNRRTNSARNQRQHRQTRKLRN